MSKILKLIAATAVGFAAGILLAPKSGKDTRADIKAKADDAKKQAKVQAEKLKHVADDSAVSFKKGADSASKDPHQLSPFL